MEHNSSCISEDSSLQVGYMIFPPDEYNNAKLIEYASVKSRRVVRSVIGVQTFALADECAAAIIFQHDLKSILKRPSRSHY